MVTKEIFIRNSLNKFVSYMESEFSSNKDLISEMRKYKDIDIVMLLYWWNENVKSSDSFIDDISKRFSTSVDPNQRKIIRKYLDVLFIS